MTNHVQKKMKDNGIEKRSLFHSILVEHLQIAVGKCFENFTGNSFDEDIAKEKSLSQVFTCEILESF